ncbi:MAG: sterol desaturase family protein [Cyanobacteria bacterium P01_G01_bin.38]
MSILQAGLAAFLMLLLGDFLSTFAYHVPEHVFGRYHCVVHHSPNRSFVHYAIRKSKPQVLMPGFLGAFPYLVLVPVLWGLSPLGGVLGLVLAELHVIWRHQFAVDYATPWWVQQLCWLFCITTPERHYLHHCDGNVAFGDVFTFYDKPAGWWLRYLRQLKRRSSQIRLGRVPSEAHSD